MIRVWVQGLALLAFEVRGFGALMLYIRIPDFSATAIKKSTCEGLFEETAVTRVKPAPEKFKTMNNSTARTKKIKKQNLKQPQPSAILPLSRMP